MVLVYVAVAKDVGSNISAAKAEVYNDKDTSVPVLAETRIVTARTVELAYLQELSNILSKLKIDDDEQVTFYTTQSIAEHGMSAEIEAGKYPNREKWAAVMEMLHHLSMIPEFKYGSAWGETLLAEAKDFLANNKGGPNDR